MHHRWRRNKYEGGLSVHPIFLDKVHGVYGYDSILFIARGAGNHYTRPKIIQRGSDKIGFGKGRPSAQLRDTTGSRAGDAIPCLASAFLLFAFNVASSVPSFPNVHSSFSNPMYRYPRQ